MLESSSMSILLVLKDNFIASDIKPVDPTTYRSIVGTLQYLTFTKPNIIHVVSQVCQHFNTLREIHLKAVK